MIYLLAALCLINGGILGWLIHARKTRRDWSDGFLAGVSSAIQNHAHWIEGHHAVSLNGFAFRCDSCGNIQSALMTPEDEYCPCTKCGFRMPAPLYQEKEAGHVY